MFKVNKRHQNDANTVVLVSLLLTFNILLTFTPSSSTVSIADSEHVKNSWEYVNTFSEFQVRTLH